MDPTPAQQSEADPAPASDARAAASPGRRIGLRLQSLLLVAALWFSLGALTIWDERVEMSNARAGATALADALSAHTARVIREAEQVAALVSWQVQNDGVSIPLAYYVGNGLIKLDVFVQVAVIDSQGYLRASTIPGFTPINLSDREHFKIHEHNPSTALMIGKPVVGRISGKTSLQFSQRINAVDGRFLGVVVVSVDPAYFTELYNGLRIGKQGLVGVVGTHNFVVLALRSDGNSSVGTTLPPDDALRRALARAPSGNLRTVSFANGRDSIVSYRTLAGYPVAVAVGYSTQEFLAPWRTRSVFLLLAALLLSCLIVLADRRTGSLLARLAAANRREIAKSEQLQQARSDAEAASRAKSAFLATMSHEIRTPMNGVIGMTEVLARSSLSADQKEMVFTIRDCASALLQIIDDILDFSKIEAGKLHLESIPVSVEEVVDGLAASLATVAQARGVALRTYVAPDLPPLVLADDTRLREILYNLVGNAIKFSSGREAIRGNVSVRVTFAEQQGAAIRFEIADNGIGMTGQTLSQLFRPFSQAEASTTRRFGGTGLGLAICRRLVSMMKGEITVTSEPGKGSTFVVTLPLAPVADAAPRSSLDLTGLACVVAPSPEFVAADIARYLAAASANVVIATDAVDAAAHLATLECPTVLICGDDYRGGPLLPTAGRVTITPTRSLLQHSAMERMVAIGAQALRRRALLDAVALAAGRAPSQGGALVDENTPLVVRTSAGAHPGVKILVAEDDEINRKVISRQLDLLGYRADMAVDGDEALRMWRETPYTLVLTDLHMPNRDGYELAQAIREEELRERRKRVPLVALTANAIHGEAARAKAFGIDDYLTKPLKLVFLQQALEHWIAPAGAAEPMTSATPAASATNELPPATAAVPAAPTAAPPVPDDAPHPEDIIDLSALRAIVGDDNETVQALLGEYVECSASLAAELRAHLDARRANEAAAVAHKLKSSSRSIGALALGELCARIEADSKQGIDMSFTELSMQFDAAYSSAIDAAHRLAQSSPADSPG
ncbi:hypothetical protein Busp01_08910 [Trinickia caryophylli]|uniref:Sensory/regulatory protein RpfC n=4 Tax=Trinickia caryophylli TaxID=28094 RepID=A0A1X7CZ53_TRICW|nr:hypothetical protein C0Z17_04275 [Trinickia caryophylli]GLU31049.1 hypothetical protein Busp01_08910 [Trinickia caryophylli]SMF05779.1 Signal transduction histidine kinase [Trinickia caryophylli]